MWSDLCMSISVGGKKLNKQVINAHARSTAKKTLKQYLLKKKKKYCF